MCEPDEQRFANSVLKAMRVIGYQRLRAVWIGKVEDKSVYRKILTRSPSALGSENVSNCGFDR